MFVRVCLFVVSDRGGGSGKSMISTKGNGEAAFGVVAFSVLSGENGQDLMVARRLEFFEVWQKL